MPRRAKLIRIEALRAELEGVIRSIEALERDGTMTGLARQDPERWNPLLDSLSAALEGRELGGVRQVLVALVAALEG